jgi:hypothetical protein
MSPEIRDRPRGMDPDRLGPDYVRLGEPPLDLLRERAHFLLELIPDLVVQVDVLLVSFLDGGVGDVGGAGPVFHPSAPPPTVICAVHAEWHVSPVREGGLVCTWRRQWCRAVSGRPCTSAGAGP